METVLRIWDVLFHEGSKVSKSFNEHSRSLVYTAISKQLKPLCVQVLFRVALGLLRLHEARLVARTEFSALATELSLVTRSATSLRCHAFMQEVCGNTGSLPRARVNKLKATSSSLSRQLVIPGSN